LELAPVPQDLGLEPGQAWGDGEHLIGQGVQPVHPSDQVGQALLQQRLLAPAQVGAHFQYRVALGQLPQLFQFFQHIHRQLAAAGTQLQHLRRTLRHDVGDLAR
jgi:hypothetical protein